MPCDLSTTQTNACASGIGKVTDRIQLLQLIAELMCEINSAGGGGGGSGTVTSVGMTVPSTLLAVSGSPVTTSGTFAVTLPDRAANLVFSGPTGGAVAVPAFRALVTQDIPWLSGNGSPEGVVTANVGAYYLDIAGSIFFGKTSGVGNTGWSQISTF